MCLHSNVLNTQKYSLFIVRSFSCWCSAALCVKDKVGEVVLFGSDGEVVVSDAVPLVVKKANEGNHEAECQTDT